MKTKMVKWLNGYMAKLTLLLIILMIFGSTIVLGQEAIDSAVSDDEVKEKIKEKFSETVDKDLDEVEEEIKGEAAAKLYSWVGDVLENKGNEFKVETIDGEKTVRPEDGATIFTLIKGVRKNIEAEEIEKDQYVIAMGPKEDNTVLGKRIIVLDEKPEVEERKVLSGLVTEVDVEKEVVAIVDNDKTEVLGFNDDSALNIIGIKSPIVEDIQLDDYLSAIVSLDEGEQIDEVKVVMVVPGKTNPQAEENQITDEDLEEMESTSSSEATPSAE